MGHHFNNKGEFQSDKHDLPPDRIRLNLKNPRSKMALLALADAYQDSDPELATDLRTRLAVLHPDEPLESVALAPKCVEVILTDQHKNNTKREIKAHTFEVTRTGVLIVGMWDGDKKIGDVVETFAPHRWVQAKVIQHEQTNDDPRFGA